MSEPARPVHQASAVVIGGRALLIEGPPGSGKSSLTLALIDRGAGLIGDDAVTLMREGAALIASPHNPPGVCRGSRSPASPATPASPPSPFPK